MSISTIADQWNRDAEEELAEEFRAGLEKKSGQDQFRLQHPLQPQKLANYDQSTKLPQCDSVYHPIITK